MESCSLFDNVTQNMTESMDQWDESMDNKNNWDLGFEIKIMALLLYLFLFTFVEYLFRKHLDMDKDLIEQATAATKTDDQESIDDSTNTEPSLEEPEKKTTEMEDKAITVDAPSAKTRAAPVKRKANATQRKKEAPKRHLMSDLSSAEPVAKKKYQELQIIIDFHDIRELKQNPEMSLPGMDIRKWPSISEIKQQQQKLRPLKNKNIPKEECESLCSYIHYTDHILLQRVYNYLQELLQLVGDGCKIIETEHQIIVKVLMVKDAIGLWEKQQLNQESKDIVRMKTCQKEQNLSLVKSGKKQGEIDLPHQLKSTDKPNVGPFKELKRKELGRQFKDARRKVLSRAAKNPAEQDVQKDVIPPTIDGENQVKFKTSEKKEIVGKDAAKSGKDAARPKNDVAKSKKEMAKLKKETANIKKESSKDVVPPQADSCKKDAATCCDDNDNDKQNVSVQVDNQKSPCQDKNIGGQEDLVYICKGVEDIKDNAEGLCKNADKYDMIYIGKDLKAQTMSCCYENISQEECVYKIAAKETMAYFCDTLEESWVTYPYKDSEVQSIVCDCKITEEDKQCLCKNPEDDMVVLCQNLEESFTFCPAENPENQYMVCSCQNSGAKGSTCNCKTIDGQCGVTCLCKHSEQKYMACRCKSNDECVACLGENAEEFTICSHKGLEEESLVCPFKNSEEEVVEYLCKNSQEQGMACSCGSLTEKLACHCKKNDEYPDCLCKINDKRGMVCSYCNHGLQDTPCPCCKTGEEGMVCSCKAPDM